MAIRRWKHILYRKLRRISVSRPSGTRRHFYSNSTIGGWMITIAVALFVSVLLIAFLEAKLKPVVTAAATVQIQNQLLALIEQTAVDDLSTRQVGYQDLVEIQRTETGLITSITADMSAMNLLRAHLVECILAELKEINISTLQIPLGSLFGSDFLWATGPSLQIKAMSVGTVQAEFDSSFTSAGVNQTRHRICLNLAVPTTVLLAGTTIDIPLKTQLCVAETIVVGQVPNLYCNLTEGSRL